MCAISLEARAAISRTTVRIVPSAGSLTEPYARSAARAMAAATSTGSTSSPGRLMSSSAAPRMSWLRMTPLLPRAPSSAARATESTIWLRPISSISPCVDRLSSSWSTARSVSAMLSPVSPSATGETFRSLTSSRRDSSCASAASTTSRKRRRLGSGTRGADPLLGLGDLAGLQAARADVRALRCTVFDDAHLLEIRVEAALGGHHRVRAALPEGGALAAGVTDSSHGGGKYRGRAPCVVRAGCRGSVDAMPPVSPARISLPDRYRVVCHLASGGMAAVWEAHDELLDRDVAVKILAPHLGEDERARRRFQREARAAAGLSSHPHVVTIYDVGEHAGRVFMVMEIMRGGTVGDRLRSGREITHATVLRWLREAAGALDTAHDAGVVHRDIKPGNLLLDGHDRLAVADFGIARLAWEDQLTATGQVLGTAAYLSPEQAMGEPATAASDRYALAVVAYELLTGTRPFEAEHFAAQARAHVEDTVPPASSRAVVPLSKAVDATLEKGLAKDPRDRWRGAAEFVDALERTLAPPEPAKPTRKLRRRGAPAPV